MQEQLNKGTYECMVCCDNIRHEVAVWSCGNCFHVFHLRCIRQWARSSFDEGWNIECWNSCSLLFCYKSQSFKCGFLYISAVYWLCNNNNALTSLSTLTGLVLIICTVIKICKLIQIWIYFIILCSLTTLVSIYVIIYSVFCHNFLITFIFSYNYIFLHYSTMLKQRALRTGKNVLDSVMYKWCLFFLTNGSTFGIICDKSFCKNLRG